MVSAVPGDNRDMLVKIPNSTSFSRQYLIYSSIIRGSVKGSPPVRIISRGVNKENTCPATAEKSNDALFKKSDWLQNEQV
jgi:hypothetical protein